MKYVKSVSVGSTGMVTAEVTDTDGNCKGLEFFSQMFSSNKATERSCKKAHAWADERIAICEAQETQRTK